MGKAATRRQPTWAATVRAVMKRAKGRCECCERGDGRAFDPHHVFGRSNQVKREYADTPELVAAICRECHDEIGAHPRGANATKLRERHWRMFARKHGFPTLMYGAGWTPLQIVRDIIRALDMRESEAA